MIKNNVATQSMQQKRAKVPMKPTTLTRCMHYLIALSPVIAAAYLPAQAQAPAQAAPAAQTAQAQTAQAQTAQQQAQAAPARHQHNPEITIEIGQPARLQALLDHAQSELRQQGTLTGDVYWPAARLILEDEAHEAEQLRQQTLNQLTHLENQGNVFAALLKEQIQHWRLGVQRYGVPNPYQARLDINANPLLQPGKYTLILPTRPSHVNIYGLTQQYGPHPFVANQTIRGYMLAQKQRGALHSDHDTDHVVLYTGGSARSPEQQHSIAHRVPWASHNAGGQQLQPGDMLFIGPRNESMRGLIPFGKLSAALNNENLSDNLHTLASYFVSDQRGTQQRTQQRTQQPPSKLRSRNSWERQNSNLLNAQDTAYPRRYTYNNYGHIGLIQMPSARNEAAGAFNISYNDMNEYYRYTVSVQLYDWLQASAFYLRLPNRLYTNDPSFSGDSILTDKGFDVKFRLWQESAYVPEVSLGLIDMAGSGLISSEYLAASKAWGPFDVTLGLGFGRLGTRAHLRNPLCSVSNHYCERPADPSGAAEYSGSGGKFEIKEWFRGDIGVFAGVEYQTPIDRLRLKLEYDSNDYSIDRAGVNFNPRTPINVGASWRLNDAIDLSVSYERGDVFTFGINIRTNFNHMSQLQINPPKAPAQLPDAAQRSNPESMAQVNWRAIDEAMRSQRTYSYSEFYVENIEPPAATAEQTSASRQRVTVYTHPWRVREQQEKLDRAARVLVGRLPESVAHIELVEQTSKQPLVAYEIDADLFRQQIANADPSTHPDDAWLNIQRIEPKPRNENLPLRRVDESEGWAIKYADRTGLPSFGIRPYLQQGYGSPETFMFYQLMASAFSTWQIDRNWQLHGSVGINVLNNYDKFNFTVDPFTTNVPRVRTYAREYMQTDVWLNRLQTSYYKALSPELHVNAYGGYLERMFAGVGAEILYRPLNAALSYGFDLNRVRQRDFDGGLGLRDYEVTTGFASVYYDVEQHVPWMQGALVTVSAGQFLAGDKGVNLNLQRRFDNGIILGAYAAFTDISSAEFGEGSFNKGFFINIPLDMFTVTPSRSRLNFGWSPLTRDGGQQLHRRSSLWYLTDERAPWLNR